jgi:hypothetical protein
MTHQEQLEMWVHQYLDIVPAGVIRDEAREFFSPERLRGCHSRSRKTFAQWVRLNLARSEHSGLLEYLQEHRLPPEVETKKTGDEVAVYSLNNGVALIPLATGEEFAIWKVPAGERLDWCLGQFPLRLRRLPPTENVFEFQLRKVRRQLADATKYGKSALIEALSQTVEELQAKVARESQRTQIPRFVLIKSIDGREQLLHRLYYKEFNDATLREGDILDCVDGDFLNYGTPQIPVTLEPLASGSGVLVRAANPDEAQPVSNFFIKKDPITQEHFEESLLPTRVTAQGDIDESSPQIQPNADFCKSTTVWGETQNVNSGTAGSGGASDSDETE